MAERLFGEAESDGCAMRAVASGSTRRSDISRPANPEYLLRRIMIAFDEQTFAKVRMRALHEQTSFAEQIRLLVSVALEQAK